MKKQNSNYLSSIKSLNNNLIYTNSFYKQLVEENHGYLKRDGSLNIEFIENKLGNRESSFEDLPGEAWVKSIKIEGTEDFIQYSSYGRTRKINKIPYYQAVQRAIEIYRKCYKNTNFIEETTSEEGGECGFSSMMDKSILSQEDIVGFNISINKILKRCIDHDKNKKPSNAGRYKSKTANNNLTKTFCLILRRYGLDEYLNEEIGKTVLDLIGDVVINSDYDCYVFLGYDKQYNIKASNGTCVRFSRDFCKLSTLIKKII